MEKEAETIKNLRKDLADLRQQSTDVKKLQSETENSLETLQASEIRYRRLFETAQDGILILNADTGQIDDVNPYMINMLHYSHEEFVGKKLWEVSPFKNTVLNMTAFEELQDKGYIRYHDLPLETKEGKSIAVEFVSNVYKANGNTVIQCNIRNITERKQAEEALRESEQGYKVLFEESTQGILMADVETGLFVAANQSICRMLGYSKAELLQLRIADIQPKDSLDHVMSEIMSQARVEQPVSRSIPCLRKDDTVFYADVVGANTIVHGRRCNVGFFMDITDRKRAEDAIVVAKNDWENTFDTVTDMITVHDANFNIIRANLAAKAILGLQLQEGMPLEKCFRFYHGTESPPSECASCQSLQTGRSSTVEIFEPYLNKHLEIRAMPRFGSDDRLIGLIHIVRDITERKQAENSLRKSEERYRQIIETTMEGIWIIDEKFRTTFVNQRLADRLAYSPEEILGKPVDSFVLAEDMDDYASKADSRRRGVGEVFERRFRRKDGTLIWNIVSSTPRFDGEGRFIGSFSMFTDITDRKKAEKALHDTLESLRRAVNTTIQVMVAAVETRDPYTAGHQLRSANLARAIATEMGLPQGKIEGIRMAGSIHDIGKLSIPAEILSKPTKLSDIEFSLIKEHAKQGYEMLKDVESPWPLAEIVYQHHERMDGSGYPRGLKGEEILIEARILNVADVVEAMASHRPYRPGLGVDAALEEIERNSGSLYDRTVADACLRLFRERGFKLEGT